MRPGKDAASGGHHDVVAFGHADQQSVDFGGNHWVTVGVGDRHRMPGQRDAERGVGGAVDDADPDSLARLGLKRRGRHGDSPVDQIVRVGDVPSVAAEQVAVNAFAFGHTCCVLHGGFVRVGQLAVELLRGLPDAVRPIVEDDDPFGVVVAWLSRIVDDGRQI